MNKKKLAFVGISLAAVLGAVALASAEPVSGIETLANNSTGGGGGSCTPYDPFCMY